MKHLITILICALNLCNYSFAQCAFPYPRHIVSGIIMSTPPESSPFAMDSSGTVYVGQTIDGYTVNLGNGITITGTGGFIAAYKSGNALWRKKITSSYSCKILDIQVDKQKNIFVSGSYMGNISIDSYNAGGSGVCYQAFILKLDSSHTCQWLHVSSGNNTTTVSSSDNDEGRYIAPDENGGCYVSIFYQSYFTFGSTVFSTTWGATNSVIAHYNSAGVLTWKRKVYSADGITKAPVVITDYNGGAYLVHYLGTTCPLDTATIYSPSQSTVFFMHIDSLGQYNWVNYLTNAWWTYQFNPSWINAGRCFNDGTLLLAGEFPDSVRIDTFVLNTPGYRSIYLARIGLNGQTLRFDKLATCLNPPNEVSIGQDGIDILPDGGIYLSGTLFGAADFNGILQDDYLGSLYTARYDSLLNPVWVRIFGGGFPGFGHFWPFGVRASTCGTAIVSGWFVDALTISPVHLNPASTGNFDFYLAEFDSADGSTYANTVGIDETPLAGDHLISPNPAEDFVELKIRNESASDNRIGIYDVMGKCVANIKPSIQNEETIRLDISSLQPGFYVIKSESEKFVPQSFIKL